MPWLVRSFVSGPQTWRRPESYKAIIEQEPNEQESRSPRIKPRVHLRVATKRAPAYADISQNEAEFSPPFHEDDLDAALFFFKGDLVQVMDLGRPWWQLPNGYVPQAGYQSASQTVRTRINQWFDAPPLEDTLIPSWVLGRIVYGPREG